MLVPMLALDPLPRLQPGYFGPAIASYDVYRIGVQKLAACAVELQPIAARHWDEIKPFPGELLVDWSTLISQEHLGRAILVTARGHKDQIAGYFVGIVCEPLFQSNKQVLSEIGFFVEPVERSVWLGRAILEYVEWLARELEFHRLEFWAMAGQPRASLLYRRQGFSAMAVQYTKEISDGR